MRKRIRKSRESPRLWKKNPLWLIPRRRC